ncbi:IdeS/Mac family cysteine endopeptidase [Gemelliphila palaticanis]|uniref:LPXTG cell wall anchor domain-containing protein n=1 Tax=Gemelliphila palaticanis TaxID=81950 RepID=A0ABX2SZG5_9BACL|nr:IdeS/Mac family cysteine endopeptidase [Gemella palaticanis]MBF0714807.1 IdeS/Mac family cysteine endopeptidase [Gemella palaticanis]NYS46737.1 LPXTG cell wall anchor domain-containing protein [Gemella palaticanis]
MKKKIKKSLSLPLVLLVVSGGVNNSYTLANNDFNYVANDPNNENEVSNLEKIKKLYPKGFQYGNNIKWVNGVIAPDASSFKIINEYSFKDTPYAFYTVLDDKGNSGNWYDINKKFSKIRDQNLCYAAVSGNMLHWWLSVNRDYINRFLSIYPNQSKENFNNKKVSSIYDYLDSYKNQEESQIFKDFTNYFKFKNHGGWTDAINDFFINGYAPNFSMIENNESSWRKESIDKRGGYFSEVFEGKILSSRYVTFSKYSFNTKLKEYLEKGMAVGVAYRIGNNSGPFHIISLWGAEFDSEGYVNAIYVTDSDDGLAKYDTLQGDKSVKKGLFRYHVTYDKGTNRPRISATTTPTEGTGGYVSYLYGLKTGKEIWESFFKQSEVMKKEQLLKDAKNSLETLIADAKSNNSEKLAEEIKKAEEKLSRAIATEQDFKEAKEELEKVLTEYKKSKEDEKNKVETGEISAEENSASKVEDKTHIEDVEKEQPQSGNAIVEDKKEDNQSDTPSITEKEAKVEASEDKKETEVSVETSSVENTAEQTVPENASTETNKEVVPNADENVVKPSTPKVNIEQPKEEIKVEETAEATKPSVEPKLEKETIKPEEPKANVEQPKEEIKVEETTETTKPSVEPKVEKETTKPEAPKVNVEQPKEEIKVEETTEATKPSVEPTVETETDQPSIQNSNELTHSIVAQVGDSKVEVLIKDENNEKYNIQVKDVTEQYKEAVLSKISEKVDSIKVFDIDLLNSSKENIVKTDKDRTVRISLVENLENKTVNIYYVDDKTGELTLIPSKVENNTVVFSVNHFSKYAVTVSENKQQPKLPNTGGLDNSTSSLGIITIMITLGLVSRRNKVK